MKYFMMFFGYLIVSGVLLGIANNVESERCGARQLITTGDAIQVSLWPMAVGIALTINEPYKKISCDKE